MKPFAWSPEKNAQLLAERQLCFEAVVVAIEAGDLLDVLEHPNQQRYPGQRILVVRLHDYIHLVPMIATQEHLLTSTTIPSSPELEPAEQQLFADFEAGELRSVATPALLSQLQEAAKATGLKDQRINICLSSADLQAIRTRAMQEGIPYQTLISSVLHKYVSGTLPERTYIARD
jgi:predicted DNA binding CopG/RHH family protein